MIVLNLKFALLKCLTLGKITPKLLRKCGGEVGENCWFGTRKIDISHAFLIQIGNNVSISDARLLTHDASTKRELGFTRVGRIVIGNDVFIGADAIILPGVKIGNRVIVGAGSVVTKDIPDDSVVVGSPARRIASYHDYISQKHDEMSKCNVYKTHYSKKSKQEIEQMKQDLMSGGIGYDV